MTSHQRAPTQAWGREARGRLRRRAADQSGLWAAGPSGAGSHRAWVAPAPAQLREWEMVAKWKVKWSVGGRSLQRWTSPGMGSARACKLWITVCISHASDMY